MGNYAKIVFSNRELLGMAISVIGCVIIGNGITELIKAGNSKIETFLKKEPKYFTEGIKIIDDVLREA